MAPPAGQPVLTRLSCPGGGRVELGWAASPAAASYAVRAVGGTREGAVQLNTTEVEAVLELEAGQLYSVAVRAGAASLHRTGQLHWADWAPATRLTVQPGCRARSSASVYLAAGQPDTLSVGVIAGLAVAAVLLLTVVAAGLAWRRYWAESYYVLEEGGTGGRGGQGGAPAWDTAGPAQHRLTAEQFLAQVKTLHLDADLQFAAYYREVMEPGQQQLASSTYEQPFYIDGYLEPRQFYCCPLPLPYKLAAFWRQVWQLRVSVMVVLEPLAREGRVVSQVYWPNTGTVRYGRYSVCLQSTTVLAAHTVRSFRLAAGRDSRTITQLEWSGGPLDPAGLLALVRAAGRQQAGSPAPTLLHTSSHHGRAGMFAAVAVGLQQLRHTGQLCLPALLRGAARPPARLTASQREFVLLHDTLAEAVVAGETEVRAAYLPRYITALQSQVGDRPGLERQHALLGADRAVGRGRDSAPDLPQGGVWLPGYFTPRACLLAPYPDQQAATARLWRAAIEHNISTIAVVRSDPHRPPPDLSDCGPGPVSVTHRDDEISFEFKTKNFILEFGHSVRKFVKVIFCDEFLAEEGSSQGSLSLVETVGRGAESGPVLVLDCSAAGERGLALCALLRLQDQQAREQRCDVFSALRIAVAAAGAESWGSPARLLQVYRVTELMIARENRAVERQQSDNKTLRKKSKFRISVANWASKKSILGMVDTH